MVELKTEAEVDAMAAAGAVVAEALQAVAAHARPGLSTAELDRVAADILARHGALSPFLNYHPAWAPRPFPAVLCVSVNDAVVHGIPNGQVLADGDLSRSTSARSCAAGAATARAASSSELHGPKMRR